jgi:hypothetical protein
MNMRQRTDMIGNSVSVATDPLDEDGAVGEALLDQSAALIIFL